METTLIILTVFVGITAISFVVQAVAMMRMADAANKMKQKVDLFLPKAEEFIHSSQTKVEEASKQVTEITERVNSILELTQKQMARVDEIMTDASWRAKGQLEHADEVLHNTLTHVNNTVNAVHGTILRPVREINGVTAGLKAAVSHLLKGGARANVAQVTTDEEMFI